jgi:hypothetical protein
VSVDQGAIRGSGRSNPATYTGLLDPIRKAFAKANGVKPALFSANSEGGNGAGVIYTDLAMMAGYGRYGALARANEPTLRRSVAGDRASATHGSATAWIRAR